MRASRFSFAAALMTLAVSAAVPSALAKTSPLAGCTLPQLDTAVASHHTPSFTDGGVTATDDWDAITATCKNGTKTLKISAKSTFHATRQSTTTSGKLTGPIVLGYSFGASQTGSFVLASRSSYTCSGGTCESNGIVARRGKRVGTFAMTFNRTARTLSWKIEFTDVVVSS